MCHRRLCQAPQVARCCSELLVEHGSYLLCCVFLRTVNHVIIQYTAQSMLLHTAVLGVMSTDRLV